MSDLLPTLTSGNLIAQATQLLQRNGYQRLRSDLSDQLSVLGARLFEDQYGVVAVLVFETWTELEQRWPDAQEGLVSLMSTKLSRSDAKAWDGYLVLLTLSSPSISSNAAVSEIRYNTSRVRKLLATGEDLRALSDVDRSLSPLLPLEGDLSPEVQESVLEALPRILEDKGVDRMLGIALVDAFIQQESLLERLYREVK